MLENSCLLLMMACKRDSRRRRKPLTDFLLVPLNQETNWTGDELCFFWTQKGWAADRHTHLHSHRLKQLEHSRDLSVFRKLLQPRETEPRSLRLIFCCNRPLQLWFIHKNPLWYSSSTCFLPPSPYSIFSIIQTIFLLLLIHNLSSRRAVIGHEPVSVIETFTQHGWGDVGYLVVLHASSLCVWELPH